MENYRHTVKDTTRHKIGYMWISRGLVKLIIRDIVEREYLFNYSGTTPDLVIHSLAKRLKVEHSPFMEEAITDASPETVTFVREAMQCGPSRGSSWMDIAYAYFPEIRDAIDAAEQHRFRLHKHDGDTPLFSS